MAVRPALGLYRTFEIANHRDVAGLGSSHMPGNSIIQICVRNGVET